jgi:hypothetical protein
MDERKEKRKKKTLLLKVDSDKGILVDISKIGLRISMDKIPSGETVDVSLKIKEKTFNLKGTIHWVEIKQTIDNSYEMGISLIDPNEEYREVVENLPSD